MKFHRWQLAFGFFLTLVAALVTSHASENTRNVAVGAKRIALVIGNARYAEAPLRNPVNDARDIAAALRSIGFDVIEKTDATQKEMNRAIAQFGERLAASSVALFYYAGHGMQVKGKNFLIPIDAEIASEASVRAEAVDVDAVLDQLGASTVNVVILDACRNNPFERRFRGSGGGLAQMEAPKGSLIAYATAPGRTAADGEGRNGLYTQELLKLIRTPGMPIESVFKRVRSNVARATADNQIPWESSSLTGDFYFIRQTDDPAPALKDAALPPAPETIELAFWQSIKDSRNPDDFRSYLAKYAEGNFAAIARNRLAELSKPPAKPEDPYEGTWTGELETYGGLFDKPVKAAVTVRVLGGRLDGDVFMYGEARKISGAVMADGELFEAKLVGTFQSYTLSGKLWQAKGQGAMGWKLNLNLRRSQ